MATKKWDVFLDTGVTVELPADVDPESEEGLKRLKEATFDKFRELFREGGVDLNYELYEEE